MPLHGLFFENFKTERRCLSVHSFFNGKMLLAGVLRKGEVYLERVIRFQDEYETHKKRKACGGVRLISVPHPTVREFQRRFLRYFCDRIAKQGWLAPELYGFVSGRSAVANARWHARSGACYVVRLDLKDAFPSVTAAEVQKALATVIRVELLRYRLAAISQGAGGRREYPRPPLFSMRKKVKWFRKLFLPGPRPKWLRRVETDEVVEEFLGLVSRLVTYQGVLPQGAPTSPFFLNLVLSHYGIPQLARKWFEARGTEVKVSVYADDFTVSSRTPIVAANVEEFMAIVERQGVFRFNREKTIFFNRRHIAPLVTGLRLVTVVESLWRPAVETVRVPKKTIRKIRGVIHRAIFDEGLRAKVEGHIHYLHGVYGPTLPLQVAKPWAKLCGRMKQ